VAKRKTRIASESTTVQRPNKSGQAILNLVAGIAALATTAVALKPVGALFWGHDLIWHLARIAQYQVGVQDGVLFPRFLHDVFFGYGGPIMVFNPPAPYVLTELFTVLGAGAFEALEAGIALAIVGGAVSLYFLAREPFGQPAALLAAGAYAVAPYRLVDAWVRAAYPELFATALIPLLLLSMRSVVRRQTSFAMVAAALATSLVVLSHPPSTVFCLPLAAAYGLWHSPSQNRRQAIFKLFGSLALGVGLSSIFWVPALADSAHTQIPLDQAKYRDNYVGVRQLFETKWAYGFSNPGPDDDMSFQLGWVHWAAALGAGWLAFFRGNQPSKAGKSRIAVAGAHRGALQHELRFWFAAGAVAIFAMTESSSFLWDVIPLLASIQFPWRLLIVPALATSIFVGALVRIFDKPARAAAVAATTALLLTVGYWSFARTICQAGERVGDSTCLSADHWNSTNTPEKLQTWIGADPVLLPTDSSKPPTFGPRAEVTEGVAQVEVVDDRTERFRARVVATSPATVRVRIFSFPGWHAAIDGVAAEIHEETDTGKILVKVLQGNHVLDLRFGLSPAGRRGAIASAISCFATLGLLVWGVTRRRRESKSLRFQPDGGV